MLFNVAIEIKHIVKVIGQHPNLDKVSEVQIFQFQFNIIVIEISFSSETFFRDFVIVVGIESSGPAL